MRVFWRVVQHVALCLLTVLVTGFAATALVRLAPGYGVDERELDTRFTSESVQALRRSHRESTGIATAYWGVLKSFASGDLGVSRAYNRPVGELLSERSATTLRLLATGLAGAWVLALALALPAAFGSSRTCDAISTVTSGFFISVPSSALALIIFAAGGPTAAVISLVVFPKIFRYVRNLIAHALELPHVLMARAKGLSPLRVAAAHVLRHSAPELAALAGVSLTLAMSAAIPVEVLCDVPGLGQLAWRAALARDLPVLTALTAAITLFTLTVNTACELGVGAASHHRI